MESFAEGTSNLIALAAAAVASWSLYLSRKSVRSEAERDFFDRRRDLLFELIETRLENDRANSLTWQLEARIARITEKHGIGAQSELTPKLTRAPASKSTEALAHLEKIVRQLGPSTPVHTVEETAASVHGMYTQVKAEVRDLEEALRNSEGGWAGLRRDSEV